MAKKILSIALALVFALSMCAAFGEAGKWEDEVSHVIMLYLTAGVTPKDLGEVQDKMNERTIPEIGVEIELRPVSFFDSAALFPAWLTNGEVFDLFFPFMQDPFSYTSSGSILPIDEYLTEENAPHLLALDAEGTGVLSNCVLDGKTWGVQPVPKAINGTGGAYIIQKKYVDETGWDYDPETVYSLDDLGELFALIAEKFPDVYPCGIITSGTTDTNFSYTDNVVDPLGSSKVYSGALIGLDGTTIENVFATEEYRDFLEHMRAWNLAGYIHPDANVSDSDAYSLMKAGVITGRFFFNSFGGIEPDEYMIKLTPIYKKSEAFGGMFLSRTSANPEAAVRFLDMLWSDVELVNLLQLGIEGKHWVMLDESIGLIGFPEGVDANNSGYANPLGLYGDKRQIYVSTPDNTLEEAQVFGAEAISHPTQGVGVAYNGNAVSNELSAVAAVVAQYVPTLECGAVDIDTYLPQFLTALEAAGIDTIIADKQAQFDNAVANR